MRARRRRHGGWQAVDPDNQVGPDTSGPTYKSRHPADAIPIPMWIGFVSTAAPRRRRPFAHHAVELLPHSCPLLLGQVGDQHLGDRVAVHEPVPHLLAGAERERLGDLLDPHVPQPAASIAARCFSTSATWKGNGGGSSGNPSNPGTTAWMAPRKNPMNSIRVGGP